MIGRLQLVQVFTALFLAALMIVSLPITGSSTLEAAPTGTSSYTANRAPVALKKRKKRPANAEKPAPTRSERGRKISRNLLLEHLPDVAAMLGFNAEAESEEPEAQPDATEVDASVEGGFEDSELADEEVEYQSEEFSEADYDDINKVYEDFTRYMSALNGDDFVTDNGVDRQAMIEAIWDWVGTRYRFGGTTRNGIDCSAFTGTVYRTLGYKLPRTAAMQWDAGEAVDREELQYGDLVFFHTRRAVYVSHVGIYLGNNLFAHASSRNGVIVSSLESNYYDSHYIGGRRFEFASAIAESGTATDGM